MVKKAGVKIVKKIVKKVFKPKKIKTKLKVVKTTKPKTTKPKTTKPETVFRPPNAKGLKERFNPNTIPKGKRVSTTVIKRTKSQKVSDAIKRNPKTAGAVGITAGGATGAGALKVTSKGKPIKRKTGTFK